MTDINEGVEPTEENEEVIDLFADGADALITDEPAPAEAGASEGTDTEGSGTAARDDPTIPQKFKDKNRAEITAIYLELEKEHGRRGNELGELRRITDDILQSQLSNNTSADNAQSTDQITSDDLLENPDKVIADAVANSPEMKELRDGRAKDAMDAAVARFKTTHDDAEKVIADPRFQQWILAHPTRAARWDKADTGYDFDTASEIISTFKEVHPVSTPEENTATNGERQKALDGVAAPASGASTAGGTSTKYLLRSELMKLKMTDPDRYERLQPQILLAYREGRVK